MSKGVRDTLSIYFGNNQVRLCIIHTIIIKRVLKCTSHQMATQHKLIFLLPVISMAKRSLLNIDDPNVEYLKTPSNSAYVFMYVCCFSLCLACTVNSLMLKHHQQTTH